MLTFPGLTAAEFQPWIDPAEAARKGTTAEAARRENGRDLEERPRRMGRGRRPDPPLPRIRRHLDLHARKHRGPAALDPALVRAAARGQRRRRDARPHLCSRRGIAGPRRHRRGSAEEPRAHPAVGHPRCRLGPRQRSSTSRAHRRDPEAAVREGRRIRRRNLLSRQGPARARDGGQQPARLARLRRSGSKARRSMSSVSCLRPRASRASRSSRSPTSTMPSACSS